MGSGHTSSTAGLARCLVGVLALVGGGCSDPSPPMGPDTPEFHLRAKLGVPPDAKRVIVFQQSAHLDVDWQHTFDDYYGLYVKDILLEARLILDADPRAHYSVTEMAFLEQHLAQHPEELTALRRHAQDGTLRIVGGGVTSPDTLLPETELLMRDFLFGAKFSEDTLGVRAHAAYLPDSFGHSATVPDLLAAAGYTSVAFARIDGAPTIYESLLADRNVIKEGSSAALLRDSGSADFYWRGPGGGRVLAHYIASGFYCTGDSIDYKDPGGITAPGTHLGPYYGDTPGFTDGQIDSYVKSLSPYSKTPYLFVPIGCDFQHPKPELLSYLDGYDQRRYPATGVYAVAATFEDYASLVGAHSDSIPEIAADLSPYFTGFYGSRADVKRKTRDAFLPFLVAEIFANVAGPDAVAAVHNAEPALSKLTRADHHDFITGTANDKVVMTEQLPLLDEAQRVGEAALDVVSKTLAARMRWASGSAIHLLALKPSTESDTAVVEVTVPRALVPSGPLDGGGAALVEAVDRGDPSNLTLRVQAGLRSFSWNAISVSPGQRPLAPQVTLALVDVNGKPATGAAVSRATLGSQMYQAVIEKGPAGFALTSLKVGARELLAGPSLLLRDYVDMGGLWRLGNEMPGCTLTAAAAPDASGEIVTILDDGALSKRISITTPSTGTVRELRLDGQAPGFDVTVTTAAPKGSTRVATFALAPALAATAPSLRTGVAGGEVERSVEKLYSPTFWPAVTYAAVDDRAILLRQSTGVRFARDGTVELMLARNAQSEQCDVEGGTGSDGATHRIEWRMQWIAPGQGAQEAARTFERPMRVILVDAAMQQANPPLPDGSVARGPILSIKPATRGDGVIVRALVTQEGDSLSLDPILGAHLYRCDAAERDLADLGPVPSTIPLSRSDGAIQTFRVR